MASVFTFKALLAVVITVASSYFAVSNGRCSQYDSNSCKTGQVCCKNECVFGSDCLDHYCCTDSDCGLLFCCTSRCRRSCSYSCSTDSDCEFSDICCYGTCLLDSACSSNGYDYTAVTVGGACAGLLIFTCLVSMCFYYKCRRRQTQYRRMFVGQSVSNTTITITRTVPQPNYNPPYVGQIPPPYQQGCQYYPPPQYEQHQTAIPPPLYNLETTATNDQPPPYSAATQDRSGGYTHF